MAKRMFTKKTKRGLAIVGALAVGGYFLLRRRPALAGLDEAEAWRRWRLTRGLEDLGEAEAWRRYRLVRGGLAGLDTVMLPKGPFGPGTIVPALPSGPFGPGTIVPIVRGEPVGPLVKLPPGLTKAAWPAGWLPGQCLCPPRTTGVLKGILT